MRLEGGEPSRTDSKGIHDARTAKPGALAKYGLVGDEEFHSDGGDEECHSDGEDEEGMAMPSRCSCAGQLSKIAML